MSQTINWLPVNGSNPSIVGGTGTSIKVWPNIPGASIGVASTQPGLIYVPGGNRLNGQRINVFATGEFEVGAGGACPSVTIALLANTAAYGATPSYTTIATSGAITAQNLTGTYYPWTMSISLFGTTNSGILNGSGSFLVDNTATTLTGLTNNLSARNFSTDPVFSLAMGITFSVSESGNSANLFQFEIQA